MSEEYAKVNSMIDDSVSDEDIIKKLPKSKGSLAGRVFRGAADKAGSAVATVTGGVGNMGMRIIAGGMAAVQTASVTSIAVVASTVLGLGIASNAGDSFPIQYRDESFPDNDYNCLDEYAEAWKGVFGTINESPLAQQTGVVIKRLREINEWSKAYVGQSIPNELVCDTEDCPYYGHTGCTDPDHKVKQQDYGLKGYYDLGGKIDLANVMRIHDFFAEYGLTDVQIAAICGIATIESRIDFTSLEGYNLSGDRYNLDPSVKTDEYGFKPWAEGIDSPIQTPTCMHEIIANTYDGPDQPIDYAAYSAEYPSIHKLGIGLVGFTDGPGFYNNTFLRNYADELNDRVTLIQRLVEGSRGWREELRQRAADIYHVIFGADGDDKRGNANDYIEKVDENTFLFFKDHPECLQELDNWDERTVDGELKSSAWLYEDAYNKYQEAERALVAAVNDYQATADEYETKLNQLKNGPWMYHTVSTSNDSGGGVLEDVTFEKHSLPDENGNGGDIDKITTNNNEDSEYLSILKLHKLYECGPSEQFEPFVEYENTYTGESKNDIDVVYAEANPIWQEDPKNPNITQNISITCQHGTGPGNPYNPTIGGGMMQTPPIEPGPYASPWEWQAYYAQLQAYNQWLIQWQNEQQYRQEQIDAEAAQIAAGQMPTAPVPPTVPSIPRPGSYPRREDYGYSPYYGWSYGNEAAYQQALNEYTTAAAVWSQYDQAMRIYNIKLSQYQQDMAYMNANGGLDFFTGTNPAAEAEHARIFALKAELDALAPQVKQKFDFMQQKKAEYDETLEDFNKWSKAFAHDIVRFYNALQDFYTASEFDMETRIRDAAYTNTSIFDETSFYTKAAYEYKFNELISGESVDFRALFGELGAGDEEESDDDENPKPTPQQLKLYYELWQNYAKYATNLPQNGKYINWWVPEVQLLYFVGGSYDAEKDQGLKIRDEYKNQSCGQCSSGLPERDTTGKYYYDWMSSWKGDDYTGRDITTATKNFFYDMVSGGFDDGTLTLRTEYAYAYYYMFQYGSPYQKAINYAGAGGEASRIMEEMIAEGRWQTNTSNTLSDTAMPHNDKWKEYQTADVTRQWEIDTSTSMSTSILSILGSNQNHSRVNLLTDIWNGCKYINVIENSTAANSAMYLVDNPLIYKDKNDKFYKMKYADYDAVENQPVSNLYKVVFNTINERLKTKGKQAMSGEPSDGFNFVKTCVLWSGMDAEFENINSIEDLHEYLKEATSSVWQDESEYQTDEDDEKAIGRGNSRIWEQRKLGPYYDENGNVYYRYKWYLVPRVLGERNVDTDLKWYDDMRNDDAERGFGEPDEDLDKWDVHNVDEHDTNNTPSIAKGEDVDGYKRKLNENKRTVDWMRIDWECWDKQCEICGGKGGHGDTNLLCAGDLLVSDDKVCLWLGEDKVQSMFPLEKNSDEKLVYAGGDEATRLKSMDDETGFEWSKPCADYINHDTPCPTHGSLNDLPKEAKKEDPESCNPYNPEGKWTVYRLITSNYTDEYRNAGIVFDITRDGEWELWYKYKYKGMSPKSDTRAYLDQVRKEIDAVINTDYPRDL